MQRLATDWPTFRGADRTAVSKETALQEWPEEGPPLVWQAEGTGRGYTSLAIAGDRIFLVGDGVAGVDEGDEYLLCQSRKDGHRLWQTKTGPAWDKGNPTWQSSRAPPTVDKDRVYALTAGGELICCDAATGAEQWRKNLKADFGGKKADGWGYSESVLIDGDRLICTPGGEKTTMAALDKRTGETIWTTVREGDRGAGHASAVIAEIGGVRRLRADHRQRGARRPRIGRQAAVVLPDRQDYGRRPDADHFERPGFLFRRLQARRTPLLKQLADRQGGITIEEIYPLKTELSNKHGGVVLVDGHLFGDTDSSGLPFCADLMTGDVAWKGRGSGRGSVAVAAAEGRLYLHFQDGTMVLAKTDPKSYVEVGSFKVPFSGERPSWAHPVILDGKLYLREHNAILCFDIREQAAPSAPAGTDARQSVYKSGAETASPPARLPGLAIRAR